MCALILQTKPRAVTKQHDPASGTVTKPKPATLLFITTHLKSGEGEGPEARRAEQIRL